MADAGQALLGGLALRQQRRQDKFNNEVIMVQQNQQVTDALIKSAGDIAQKSREAGKEFDLTAFRERLEGHVIMAGKLRQQQFQTDPDIISSSIASALSQFDAATAAAGLTPTPTEEAVTGAKAGVAGAVATAGAMTEAGRKTSLDEAARAANILPEDALQLRNITDDEGKTDIIAVDREGNEVNRIEGGFDTKVELTGAFTKGTKKDAEGRVLATTQLLRNAAKLSGLVSDKTVGAIPAFRGFLNTTIAQWVPGIFDADRAAFQSFNNLTRQSAMRVVSDESRFSENDRIFIHKLFPADGAFDSEPNAAMKMTVAQAFFVDRLLPDLKAAGLDPADFDTGLEPAVVREATLNGFLNEDQAALILNTLWPEVFPD